MDAAQIRASAHEAALYGMASVVQYRTLWLQALDQTAEDYVGFGSWLIGDLPGPDNRDIVGASRDTAYNYAWLDLRAEPTVVTVPPIGPQGRYYTSQFNDMLGHVIGNVSALHDGYDGGDYLVAPPGRDGEVPEGITSVLRSETYFAVSLTRVEVMGESDLADVRAIQEGFGLQSGRVVLGGRARRAPPRTAPSPPIALHGRTARAPAVPVASLLAAKPSGP